MKAKVVLKKMPVFIVTDCGNPTSGWIMSDKCGRPIHKEHPLLIYTDEEVAEEKQLSIVGKVIKGHLVFKGEK